MLCCFGGKGRIKEHKNNSIDIGVSLEAESELRTEHDHVKGESAAVDGKPAERPPPQPPVEVANFESLPEDILAKVTSCGIAADKGNKNLKILFKILKFTNKLDFITPEQASRRKSRNLTSSNPNPHPDGTPEILSDILSSEKTNNNNNNPGGSNNGTNPPSPTKEMDNLQLPNQPMPVASPLKRSSSMRKPPDFLKLAEDTVKKENPSGYFRQLMISGKGGFGRVFSSMIRPKALQFLPPFTDQVAIKVIPHRNEKERTRNLTEIAHLVRWVHPNIVKYYWAHELDRRSGKQIWLVTEFMQGGTLAEASQKFKFEEKHVAYAAREMLKALEFLHSTNHAHRDLKSANVMMSVDGDIKLIDFGLCSELRYRERSRRKKLSSSTSTSDSSLMSSNSAMETNSGTGSGISSNGGGGATIAAAAPVASEGGHRSRKQKKDIMCGSPFWMAPEMIQGKHYGVLVDIWSLGVCLLEMIYQRPPNSNSRIYAMFQAATEGIELDPAFTYSPLFEDFFKKCLTVNPDHRATASELLLHPFLKTAASREDMQTILRHIFFLNSIVAAGIA